MPPKAQPQSWGLFTPLSIIAMFVGLTETVLGVGVTQVTGGVQYALTTFVIVFPLLVSAGFFLVLWYRPVVFYAPRDYAGINPTVFMDALRRTSIPEDIAQKVSNAEQKPFDEIAKFQLLDGFIDGAFMQHIIAMFEQGVSIPLTQTAEFPYGFPYFEASAKSASQGSLMATNFIQKLKGTGFLDASDGTIRLSDAGKRFGKWLVDNGRKSEVFQSQFANWGDSSRLPAHIRDFVQGRGFNSSGNSGNPSGPAPDQPAG